MKQLKQMDRELLRLLSGEVSTEERQELESRLEAEPDLASRHQELERLWNRIEQPPEWPATDLGSALLERLESPARWRGRAQEMPVWARVAAPTSLLVGLALGLLAGRSPTTELTMERWWTLPPSLAELYLEAEDDRGAEASWNDLEVEP